MREAREVRSLPIAGAPHAMHIPLNSLRDRLAELDPEQPTVVACRSGMRSYLGTRYLAQHGFREVYNLSGAVAMRDFAFNRRLPPTLATATGLPAPDAVISTDRLDRGPTAHARPAPVALVLLAARGCLAECQGGTRGLRVWSATPGILMVHLPSMSMVPDDRSSARSTR